MRFKERQRIKTKKTGTRWEHGGDMLDGACGLIMDHDVDDNSYHVLLDYDGGTYWFDESEIELISESKSKSSKSKPKVETETKKKIQINFNY